MENKAVRAFLLFYYMIKRVLLHTPAALFPDLITVQVPDVIACASLHVIFYLNNINVNSVFTLFCFTKYGSIDDTS